MHRDPENGMILGDYEPMVYPDAAVCYCVLCGALIYPGDKYLDIGDTYCEECVRKHMKEAQHS